MAVLARSAGGRAAEISATVCTSSGQPICSAKVSCTSLETPHSAEPTGASGSISAPLTTAPTRSATAVTPRARRAPAAGRAPIQRSPATAPAASSIG